MVAWENIAFITGACGKEMAMSFIGPSDGKAVASRQQCQIAQRRSEV